MSDTDSFIDEVTEEVRRDQLFAKIKKYGWIAVVAVVVIVGGASWNEYQKATARAAAEATGDALIDALETGELSDRIAALSEAELESADAEVVRRFLLSAARVDAGETTDAATVLNDFLAEEAELSPLYRDVAAFKAILAQSAELSSEERRLAFDVLAQPGRPLSLLASEQLALIDIEAGATDVAIERLQAIALDASATAGLRRRASQLIVALGGDPEALSATTEDQ